MLYFRYKSPQIQNRISKKSKSETEKEETMHIHTLVMDDNIRGEEKNESGLLFLF